MRHTLRICGLGSSSCFLASIGLGHFRQLKELILLEEKIPLTCLSTLAGLIAEGALPVLESFYIYRSQERGATGTGVIMHGFQAGGCPLLIMLDVPIPFYRTSVNANGQEVKEKDEEQTERNMEALADPFEARAAAGNCQGLHYLGSDWLSNGSTEVRIRLRRALLPSIKEFPTYLDGTSTLPEL